MVALVDLSPYPLTDTRPDAPPVELREPALRRLVDARRSGDQIGIRRCESAIVQQYCPLADRIAGRYRGRGIEDDDLRQLARFGLFKAVHRWQPERCPTLVQFAAPTIEGEIKRYFRDHCRPIRMPRSLQEDRAAHQRAEADLQQELGRTPTVDEIADAAGSTPVRVHRQRLASRMCQPLSADAGLASALDGLGCDAAARSLLGVDESVSLGSAIRRLGPRERRLLRLRFIDDLSQTEIAARLGVSQMQISRLLRATLARLHAELT